MAQRPYIVGNWKMHGTRAMLSEARAIDRAAERLIKAEVALAPPVTLIHATRKEAGLIGVGAPVSTSGSHMWNGAPPNLNAMPATMNTTPVTSIADDAAPCEAAPIAARSSVPVAP